ncbi:type II secretion system protein GspD [Croceivirga radicis]|uniref:type II secretion system protein GspD n=1 Tax=Croceivirga radicis TaxID=1929488 RepID=UPI000255B31C|nr:general secretion pathway protein D [Croceivirga radicis]
MKLKILLLFLCFCTTTVSIGQANRIDSLSQKLSEFKKEFPEYDELVAFDTNVNQVSLSNFLMGISQLHNLNISVSNEISNIQIITNFNNVKIHELILYLCKEYNLTIEIIGSILVVKKHIPEPPKVLEKEINIAYSNKSKKLDIDLRNDNLSKVFRKLMNLTQENILYANDIANLPLNIYLKDVPIDVALEKIANSNGLSYNQSVDGFHLLRKTSNEYPESDFSFTGKSNLYRIIDSTNAILSVNFKQTPVSTIIKSLAQDLNLNIYVSSPLEDMGKVTFSAKQILFDDLLVHIFESQKKIDAKRTEQENSQSRSRLGNPPITSQQEDVFTFKKSGNIYFFGTQSQLSLRQTEVVQMMYRSIELLSDPQSNNSRGRSAGRTTTGNINYGNNTAGLNNYNNSSNFNTNRTIDSRESNFTNYNSQVEALVNILPEEIKSNLDIKVDYELNSFLVSGPSFNIQKFKEFIKRIDKPVPVVLIEVMIIEVKKSSMVETGISWGIDNEPVQTSGSTFPSTNMTLGANTVNKVIGGFDGFGSLNIGKVVPEFFATIKAMEQNGNLKIRSTPKLSTLNGHRANLSIGETTYYVVTNQNFFGSQIPTTSEVRNYVPIDAELGISIKPLVSGNGQVTLEINVIQSDFSGERIEDDAPPGLTSREFSSIIRMQNQDLAILGGLEEKIKNDSGNGVPLLARIPILKWLFSSRKREDSKQKLTILIKPTVIY